jgi:hypothetical protein
MLIRNSFEKGGTATNVILEKYAPKTLLPSPISTIDLTIRMPTSMFYYTPKNAESAPTILWIHGGGWLAGNKKRPQPMGTNSRRQRFQRHRAQLLPSTREEISPPNRAGKCRTSLFQRSRR